MYIYINVMLYVVCCCYVLIRLLS